MRKLASAAILAIGFSTSVALAADMAVKAPAAAPAVTSPWDVAFGGALMNDYEFRGITQSAHKPSVAAYGELRYNINKDLQLYYGNAGESIDFPNHAAAEIDFYGGFRPTFDKLALDFGFWYYYYPGGITFTGFVPGPGGSTFVGATDSLCTNGFVALNGFCNPLKGNVSFWEAYGKATYTSAISLRSPATSTTRRPGSTRARGACSPRASSSGRPRALGSRRTGAPISRARSGIIGSGPPTRSMEFPQIAAASRTSRRESNILTSRPGTSGLRSPIRCSRSTCAIGTPTFPRRTATS